MANHILRSDSRSENTGQQKKKEERQQEKKTTAQLISGIRRKKSDSKTKESLDSLTGSLVFDEEQLEALLERVLVHVELHLHPEEEEEGRRGGQRQRDRWR